MGRSRAVGGRSPSNAHPSDATAEGLGRAETEVWGTGPLIKPLVRRRLPAATLRNDVARRITGRGNFDARRTVDWGVAIQLG